MNALPIVGAALALGLVVTTALAQSPPTPATMQPPMNDFTQAFYKCDGGLSFMMSYDDEKPTTADMATNDEGRRYKLKRTTSPSGVQFSGGGARFWTDGKTVVVEGTKAAFKNCKIKSS
jgi:membrane-bound inhibitor of C-type lysozyme